MASEMQFRTTHLKQGSMLKPEGTGANNTDNCGKKSL